MKTKPDSDKKQIRRFPPAFAAGVLLLCLSVFLSACSSAALRTGQESNEGQRLTPEICGRCAPSPVNDPTGSAIRTEIEEQIRSRERQQEGEKGSEEPGSDEPQSGQPEPSEPAVVLLPGFSESFVSLLSEDEQAEALAMNEQGFVYYRQNWSTLKDLPYGSDGLQFGMCGCGPTCVAEVVSTLAGVELTPDQVREKAIASYAVLENGATGYGFIVKTIQSYGIHAEEHFIFEKESALRALSEGAILFITVGSGDFTLESHFMLVRGLAESGNVLISDSYSFDNSMREWDWDELSAQMKNGIWYFSLGEP